MIENEVLSAIKARRSCRAYQPDQIKPEELDAVLEGRYLGTHGMNRQSPVIVVVQDKETRDKLSAINAAIMGSSGDPFYGAPTVLVGAVRPQRPHPRGGRFPGDRRSAAGSFQHRAGLLLDSPRQGNL